MKPIEPMEPMERMKRMKPMNPTTETPLGIASARFRRSTVYILNSMIAAFTGVFRRNSGLVQVLSLILTAKAATQLNPS